MMMVMMIMVVLEEALAYDGPWRTKIKAYKASETDQTAEADDAKLRLGRISSGTRCKVELFIM
jgi:hypothetical protein